MHGLDLHLVHPHGNFLDRDLDLDLVRDRDLPPAEHVLHVWHTHGHESHFVQPHASLVDRPRDLHRRDKCRLDIVVIFLGLLYRNVSFFQVVE